jgi:hypothetical protein
MTTEYEKQAQDFLDKYGFTFKAVMSNTKEPTWDGPHGDHYVVTIRRKADKRGIRFNFWGSYHDKQNNIALTPYDVLASISGDASLPTDPDELMAEIGPMKIKQALTTVRWTERLREFFTTEEMDALAEIN